MLLVADVNATISSRLATSGYTAPLNLTAAQIATGVWQDNTAGDFTTSGSSGKMLITTLPAEFPSGFSSVQFSVSGAINANITDWAGTATGSLASFPSSGTLSTFAAGGSVNATQIGGQNVTLDSHNDLEVDSVYLGTVSTGTSMLSAYGSI